MKVEACIKSPLDFRFQRLLVQLCLARPPIASWQGQWVRVVQGRAAPAKSHLEITRVFGKLPLSSIFFFLLYILLSDSATPVSEMLGVVVRDHLINCFRTRASSLGIIRLDGHNGPQPGPGPCEISLRPSSRLCCKHESKHAGQIAVPTDGRAILLKDRDYARYSCL